MGKADEEEIVDIDDDLEICPRCRVNYLTEGEKYCESCIAEIKAEKAKISDDIEPDEWSKIDSDDDDDIDDVEEDDEDVPCLLKSLPKKRNGKRTTRYLRTKKI